MKRKINRRVYETVARKRAWEGPRAPAEAAHEESIGSKGWYTRGYLPHYDKPGTIQMVTFRLTEAMPLHAAMNGRHCSQSKTSASSAPNSKRISIVAMVSVT